MDINSQPASDQSELTQPMPVAQKSVHGLLMVICALLLLSLLGNIYFLAQISGIGIFGKLQNCRVPLEQEQNPVNQMGEQPTTDIDNENNATNPTIKTIDNFSKLSIAIPGDWTVQVKPFENLNNTLGFKSKYFATCTSHCQGVRLTKGETNIDLIFDKIMDSMGGLCSNNVTIVKLSNGWYRVQDSKNYTYAKKGITFDQTLGEVFQVVPKTETSDWSYENGQKYKACLSYTGELLDILPDDSDPKLTDYALMLEYPTVSIKTPEATLKEIDQIISSI